jgi:branched-chain amino acid transport system substrate-binding protein
MVHLDGAAQGAGRQAWLALKLAERVVNEAGGVRLRAGSPQQLEIAVYDDGGVADRSLASVRRLQQIEEAIAVVGPTSPSSAETVINAHQALRVPIVALAPTREPPRPPWTFSLSLGDHVAIEHLVGFLAASGVDRITWVAPRTAAAASAFDQLGKLVQARRIRVLATESYALSEPDLSSTMARMVFAGSTEIIAWPRDEVDAAALAQAFAPQSTRARLYLGPGAVDDRFLTLTGTRSREVRVVATRVNIPNELWQSDPLRQPVTDFVTRFRRTYDTAPSQVAAQAWDAAWLIVRAIEAAGPDPASMRDWLASTTDYPGASGTIRFGPSGRSGLSGDAYLIARAVGGAWRALP